MTPLACMRARGAMAFSLAVGNSESSAPLRCIDRTATARKAAVPFVSAMLVVPYRVGILVQSDWQFVGSSLRFPAVCPMVCLRE